MKIYTKKGDKGLTSLLGGKRVSKSHRRIESYGNVDELNSYIGLLRDLIGEDKEIKDLLIEIQDRLFVIGSSLASDPTKSKIKLPQLYESDSLLLEKSIDAMNEHLPEMRSFVLPGGHSTVSFCHIARCVCRRTERTAISLAKKEFVNPLVIIYLNRLSDFLFVLSRKLVYDHKVSEILWTPRM